MVITELLPKIHDLPRADKFKVLRFLTSELSAEEEPSLVPGGEYPDAGEGGSSQAVGKPSP